MIFRRLPACALLVACFALPVSFAQAQWFEFCDDFGKPRLQQRDPFEERIETERHDFTQSATTVGRGVFQLEGGYSYFYKDDGEEIESAHVGPEMLMRVGLSEDIEFRLRWNHAWIFPKEEPALIGSEDLRYSLKLQMTRETAESLMPTTALEIRGGAPTGDVFSTGNAEFSLDYIYQWELTECSTLAGSTGFGTNGFGDFGLVPAEKSEFFTVLSQSVALGFELSERNTMYSEYFGFYSNGLAEEFSSSYFNIGVDHYVNDDFVLDFRVGVGLSGDGDDVFSGVGGGFRF